MPRTVRDRDPSQRALNPDGLFSIGGACALPTAAGCRVMSLAVPLHPHRYPALGNRSRGDVRLLFSLTSRLLPWRF
jgi:hypothetical protein